MKANELMIGDWVTFKDCQRENPMPIKIIAIGYQADTENDCLVQIDGDKVCDIITIDEEIVGIPLTAEILEKNGFFEDGYGEHIHFEVDYGKWVYEDEDGFEVCGQGYDCNYVHELQHALRLCGIDKEIIL